MYFGTLEPNERSGFVAVLVDGAGVKVLPPIVQLVPPPVANVPRRGSPASRSRVSVPIERPEALASEKGVIDDVPRPNESAIIAPLQKV